MLDVTTYISLSFSVIFLYITPFPALSAILAAYLRFSFAAVPLVICASPVSGTLQCFIGKYVPRSRRTRRLPNKYPFICRFNKLLSQIKLETLVSIRLVKFIPLKIFNVLCGVSKVPFLLFALSMFPSVVYY